jgi:signal transduction histidine kinase
MYSRPTGWSSRIPLRRVSIRTKLALALVVPTIALVATAGYRYVDIASQTDETERQTRLAAEADGPTGLILALQNERNFAVVELIGQQNLINLPVESYEDAFQQTDAALQGFRDRLADVTDPEITAAYTQAVENMPAIDGIRADLQGFTGERSLNSTETTEFANNIFTEYSALIEPFFDGTTQIAGSLDEPDLRQGAQLIDTTARLSEVIGQVVRNAIAIAITTEGGLNTAEEIDLIAGQWGRTEQYYHRIGLTQTGRYADIPSEHQDAFMGGVQENIEAALETGTLNIPAMLESVSISNERSFNGFRDDVAERLGELADEQNSDAAARQRFMLLVLVLTVLMAAAAVVIAALSITRPLQRLRQQADHMARRGLPEAVSQVLATPLGEDVPTPELQPIDVGSRDEVADLGESLTQVQQSTLRLAVGQAVLRKNVSDSLVNLGRRNQSLLARQLDFITQLERDEADPDTLGDLFRLDHLATRMRRNAESLLVLAGVQTPRRWTAPVKIGDVVRASLSEVEDYRRAKPGYIEAVTIPGSVAADLAHLMAELVENALIFSPPDEVVEINGLSQIAGYTITIQDRGLGMRPYEIAQANRRLAGAESFTVAPSKYLGHYVAGNLAVRHNIHVQLRPTPGHGVTATIHVPAWLAAPDEGTPAPRYGSHLLGEQTGLEGAGRGPDPGSPLANGVPDLPEPAGATGSWPKVGRSVFGPQPGGEPRRVDVTGDVPVVNRRVTTR